LSRVFCQDLHDERLVSEVARARARLSYWSQQPASVLRAARAELLALVATRTNTRQAGG
jgi:hypothetical protein